MLPDRFHYAAAATCFYAGEREQFRQAGPVLRKVPAALHVSKRFQVRQTDKTSVTTTSAVGIETKGEPQFVSAQQTANR